MTYFNTRDLTHKEIPYVEILALKPKISTLNKESVTPY